MSFIDCSKKYSIARKKRLARMNRRTSRTTLRLAIPFRSRPKTVFVFWARAERPRVEKGNT